jgi:PAS domain S-box-containing protein
LTLHYGDDVHLDPWLALPAPHSRRICATNFPGLDLSDQAITLYTSDSVVDVLGYTPDELVNTSAWDHFHPDELPLAQHIHGQKIRADKAAVLAYCRIQNKSGEWVGCECCFSIVYDVMIACTSVYQRGLSSESVSILQVVTEAGQTG